MSEARLTGALSSLVTGNKEASFRYSMIARILYWTLNTSDPDENRTGSVVISWASISGPRGALGVLVQT